MKSGIHPTYNKITVTCACGAKFDFNSTTKSFTVEVCSKCHPFYTGKQKLVDTAGMVDKFKARQQAFEKRAAEQVKRDKGKTKKETVEEKITRKAQEKEEVKAEIKAKEEEKKKAKAKKDAEKTVVKKTEKKK